MEGAPSAAEGLAEPVAARNRASARLTQVQRQQQQAGADREAARKALVEAERRASSPAERTKLEKALTEAEARVVERWPERIEGARRDVRAFARQNFCALLGDAERAEALAAEHVNAAGEEFLRVVAAHIEASQNLRATVALAHRLSDDLRATVANAVFRRTSRCAASTRPTQPRSSSAQRASPHPRHSSRR